MWYCMYCRVLITKPKQRSGVGFKCPSKTSAAVNTGYHLTNCQIPVCRFSLSLRKRYHLIRSFFFVHIDTRPSLHLLLCVFKFLPRLAAPQTYPQKNANERLLTFVLKVQRENHRDSILHATITQSRDYFLRIHPVALLRTIVNLAANRRVDFFVYKQASRERGLAYSP